MTKRNCRIREVRNLESFKVRPQTPKVSGVSVGMSSKSLSPNSSEAVHETQLGMAWAALVDEAEKVKRNELYKKFPNFLGFFDQRKRE